MKALLPEWPRTTYLQIAFMVALLLLLSRGISLFSVAFSTDDYYILSANEINFQTLAGQTIAQGRFGQAAMAEILWQLGIPSTWVVTLSAGLLIAALIVSGLIICRLWNIHSDVALSCIVISLFALHPYQTEIFTFKTATIYSAITMLLAFASLLLCYRSIPFMLLGVVLFTISLSIYQINLNLVVITICFDFIINSRTLNSPDDKTPGGTLALPRRYFYMIATVLVGTVLYFVLAKVASILHGSGLQERAALLSVSQFPTRLRAVADLYENMFFGKELLVKIPVKIILCLFVVVAALGYIRANIGRTGIALSLSRWIFVSLAFLIAIVSVIGLSFASGVWWPVPRVLIGIGLFWAGIFAVAYVNSPSFVQRTLLILAVPVLVSFIGVSNRILVDQVCLNVQDRSMANRIIARLEVDPQFSPAMRIAVNGGLWRRPVGEETVLGDMNISAFSPAWSKLNILRLISGYDFKVPTADDAEQAKIYCTSVQKWPHADSIHIADGLCFICLPEP